MGSINCCITKQQDTEFNSKFQDEMTQSESEFEIESTMYSDGKTSENSLKEKAKYSKSNELRMLSKPKSPTGSAGTSKEFSFNQISIKSSKSITSKSIERPAPPAAAQTKLSLTAEKPKSNAKMNFSADGSQRAKRKREPAASQCKSEMTDRLESNFLYS